MESIEAALQNIMGLSTSQNEQRGETFERSGNLPLLLLGYIRCCSAGQTELNKLDWLACMQTTVVA